MSGLYDRIWLTCLLLCFICTGCAGEPLNASVRLTNADGFQISTKDPLNTLEYESRMPGTEELFQNLEELEVGFQRAGEQRLIVKGKRLKGKTYYKDNGMVLNAYGVKCRDLRAFTLVDFRIEEIFFSEGVSSVYKVGDTLTLYEEYWLDPENEQAVFGGYRLSPLFFRGEEAILYLSSSPEGVSVGEGEKTVVQNVWLRYATFIINDDTLAFSSAENEEQTSASDKNRYYGLTSLYPGIFKKYAVNG